MATYASFVVTLGAASSSDIKFDYTTINGTATAYGDYVVAKGTAVVPAGQTSKIVRVRIEASTTSIDPKALSLVISNPIRCTLGSVTTKECVISGPPATAAVSFPGRRAAILGDSTSYMCHHWNPALPSQYGSSVMRYEFYGTGKTGWFGQAMQLMGHPLVLEPAMQGNYNPGVNATAAKNGTNFAIYSSQVAQWDEADFDPLASIDTGTALAHNVGPYYNAIAHIDKFDVAFIMGGTNDLSAGLSGSSILNNIKTFAYGLAAHGKWVFVWTITPRTADLLQAVNGVGGYSQAQIVAIMQTLLTINQGIRDWINNEHPANIFLIDPWSALVGPTASIIAGTPTDPAGMLSPSSGITSGSLTPSTPGNYRSDAPNTRMMFDGLHEADPGAYVMAKVMQIALTAAGVPAAVAGQLGPLTIGTNLMANPTFVTSSTPRSLGAPLVLGRSTCLGAPVGWSSPGFPAGYAGSGVDRNANQGAGYAHGPMPDHWFLYREANSSDGPTQGGSATEESYSNFNYYTFSSFVASGGYSGGVPSGFTVDSTWPDGSLVTSAITVGGVPGFRLDFTCPVTGNRNEGFVLRYLLGEGQHGPWDNYGYESGATATTITPPYSPGDFVAADAVVKYSNLSGNLYCYRLVAEFLDINNTAVASGDVSTSGAVISGIGNVESFFPFSNIVNCQMHPEAKTLHQRSPAVPAPTPASGETLRYLQVDFQWAFDCSSQPARATIDVFSPRVAKITGTL